MARNPHPTREWRDDSRDSRWEALEASLVERSFGVPDDDFVFWVFFDAVKTLAADARLERSS